MRFGIFTDTGVISVTVWAVPTLEIPEILAVSRSKLAIELGLGT